MALAHDISAGPRTQDVQISKDVSFDTMLLSKPTLKGLKKAGFLRPSPIQLHGIPLGKCGFDLLLEAKSGTGKTAVFTVIALEKLNLDLGVQAIILAPTREIASQIADVVTKIGSKYIGLNVAVVMGGLPVAEDIQKFSKNIQIVVGSPGRLRHLIQDDHINISAVRLIVLDEADKLMEKSFLPDINYIFSLLPKEKQVIMSSATYSKETKEFISKYVVKAQHVCPNSTSILLGIAQKVVIVPSNSNIVKQTRHRYEELKKILNSKQFKQCLIFCNYHVRVGELHKMLSKDKWPCEQLFGQQEQTQRLDALKTLQEYKCRILVSTDLAARGIDASNVDIVINFEPPHDWQTYLHRIGRAGRYGSYGTAISILSEGKEKTRFKEKLARTKINFNLQGLWDDEPFNLSLKEDTIEKEKILDTIPQNNDILQNGEKSENILWKALTTQSLEQDIKQETSNFKLSSGSVQISSEPNIDTFSDLMQSFKINNNEISNSKDDFEFKHVKVETIPMVDGVKYWDNPDAKYTNPVNENTPINLTLPDITTIITNEDSPSKKKTTNINARHSNKEIQGESSEDSSESDEAASLRKLNYQKTKPDNVSDAQVMSQNDLERKSDDVKIDPMQAMVSMGLPTAFGKIKQDKTHCRIKKCHELNNDSNTKDTDINSNKKTVVEETFTATSGKKKHIESHSQIDSYNNNNNEIYTKQKTDIDPGEWTLVDEDATIFGQHKNNNRTEIFCSNDNKRKEIKKTKVKQIQLKTTKFQKTDRNEAKNNNFSKTFTRESFVQCLSTTESESELSDSQSETSEFDNNTYKLGNDYETHASTSNETPSNYQSKRHSSNSRKIREKQFDMWYKQLKYQAQYIQYVSYIEALRRL